MSTEKIRELNDTFRATMTGGVVVMTAGVDALPADAKATAVRRVATFTEFTPDDDPYGEHDFGSFDLAGWTVLLENRLQRRRHGTPLRRSGRLYENHASAHHHARQRILSDGSSLAVRAPAQATVVSVASKHAASGRGGQRLNVRLLTTPERKYCSTCTSERTQHLYICGGVFCQAKFLALVANTAGRCFSTAWALPALLTLAKCVDLCYNRCNTNSSLYYR
jgi:Protein of unknown function (DUF3768)